MASSITRVYEVLTEEGMREFRKEVLGESAAAVLNGPPTIKSDDFHEGVTKLPEDYTGEIVTTESPVGTGTVLRPTDSSGKQIP